MKPVLTYYDLFVIVCKKIQKHDRALFIFRIDKIFTVCNPGNADTDTRNTQTVNVFL